jgi:hypothetical protein
MKLVAAPPPFKQHCVAKTGDQDISQGLFSLKIVFEWIETFHAGAAAALFGRKKKLAADHADIGKEQVKETIKHGKPLLSSAKT